MARRRAVAKRGLKLLTDQAIGEPGKETTADGLGFDAYAKVLSDVAVGTEGPFTVGVFGEWGTGKTSLLKMVHSRLAKEEGVATIWFNAWRYEGEEHPVVPLIATILAGLEGQASFFDGVKDKGKGFLTALRAVAYGFSASSKVSIPGFAEVEAAFVAKDMIDRESALTRDPLLDRSVYFEAFERLQTARVPRNRKVVVVIDDLDRCFPDRAIRLLESIKLVLAQEGFIFVLGVARNVIEGYLRHRYSENYGLHDDEGRFYLDKIVQLPFHIPSHESRISDLAEKLLEQLDPEPRDQLKSVLPLVGAATGANPRSLIRFVNNLLVDISVSGGLANQIGLFAITRALQLRWPVHFRELEGNDSECKALAEKLRERRPLGSLYENDRALVKILATKHGLTWLSNEELRREAVGFLTSRKVEEADSISTEESVARVRFLHEGIKARDLAWDLGMALDASIQNLERRSRVYRSPYFDATVIFLETDDPEAWPLNWADAEILVVIVGSSSADASGFATVPVNSPDALGSFLVFRTLPTDRFGTRRAIQQFLDD